MAALRSTKRRSCPLGMLLFLARAPSTLPMTPPVAMKNNHAPDIEPMGGSSGSPGIDAVRFSLCWSRLYLNHKLPPFCPHNGSIPPSSDVPS